MLPVSRKSHLFALKQPLLVCVGYWCSSIDPCASKLRWFTKHYCICCGTFSSDCELLQPLFWPTTMRHLIDKTRDVFYQDPHVLLEISGDGVEARQNDSNATKPVVLRSTILAILLIVSATVMNVGVLLKSFER